MMNRKSDRLWAALNDIDAAYIEEALDFKPRQRSRTVRIPRLSAVCAAVLIVLGLSATAFALSRLPLSWRDIFSPSQTVIGDDDEVPVVSQQQQPEQQQTVPTEEMQIEIEKSANKKSSPK